MPPEESTMERREVEVCIVGAGFAGLAAARALINDGRTVALLEARDRVGGRVWNKTLEDGTVVSVGGTWLGKDQHRMQSLVKEVGLSRYRQYVGKCDPADPEDPLNPFDDAAEFILRLDGVNKRYKGMYAPVGLAGLANLGIALTLLEEMRKGVPLDAPWDADNAASLDEQTLGKWIDTYIPFDRARRMFRSAMGLMYSCDPAQVSLLGTMAFANGGGDDGLNYYLDSGNTETHIVDGGTPEVARRLGVELGDRLCTSTPVRRIVHDGDGVEVISDRVAVTAKYVIVTAPPVLASQIQFEPMLPDGHVQLARQMPPGAIWRFIAVYDSPFWRDKGLSGQTIAPDSPVAVSIDQCPKPGPDGTPDRGVLSCYAVGAAAVELSKLDPDSRKQLVLEELALRFDDDVARAARAFSETNWTAEQWSQGGMIAHFPPGVLTSYGSALHEPAGRIYFAGAERARLMFGLMEGAVRSGEEAAAHISQQLAVQAAAVV
jgi:monoamine oxidase